MWPEVSKSGVELTNVLGLGNLNGVHIFERKTAEEGFGEEYEKLRFGRTE